MRWWLLLLVLVPFSWTARAQTPTLAWATSPMVSASSNTCTVTVPATQTANVGDELIVFIPLGTQNLTITTPSTSGVTWSAGTTGTSCFNAGGNEEACAITGTVTSSQVAGTSFSFTESTNHMAARCDMFDVAGTNNTVDYINGGQPGGSTSMTIPVTLSKANAFVAAFIYNYSNTDFGTVSFGAGWTGTPTNVNIVFYPGNLSAADFYNVQTASGTPGLVVNWTNPTWADYVLVALQPGAGAAAATGFFW